MIQGIGNLVPLAVELLHTHFILKLYAKKYIDHSVVVDCKI